MARKRRGSLSPSQKKIFFGILFSAVMVAILLASGLLGIRSRPISATLLSCTPSQNPKAFGSHIVYSDSTHIHCINSQNRHLWSYAVGNNLQYDVGSSHIIAWTGNTVHIIDRNGVSTYSNSFDRPILLAKMGTRRAAYAIQSESAEDSAAVGAKSTQIILVDLNGNIVDDKIKPLENVSLLDFGFYENSQYFWITVLDTLGTAPNTRLYWYSDTLDKHSAKTQTFTDLGEEINYRVVYSNGTLNIINTKEIRRYAYNLSDTNTSTNRVLVYGWQHIDDVVGEGDAKLLLAPVTGDETISELRLVIGKKDFRYTLPDACVGAGIRGSTIFAFSSDALYTAGINAQRFSPVHLNNLVEPITALLDKTRDGNAIIACGNKVYALNLP